MIYAHSISHQVAKGDPDPARRTTMMCGTTPPGTCRWLDGSVGTAGQEVLAQASVLSLDRWRAPELKAP
jgi:hypothetical protein